MSMVASPIGRSAEESACQLDPDRPFSSWPPDVRALETAESSDRVARELRFLNMVGLALTFVYLGFDIAAGILPLGVAVRLPIMVPIYLLALAYSGAVGKVRSITSGLALVAFAGVVAYLGLQSEQPHLDRYLMGIGVVVGFYIILTPLRAGHCAWVGAASFLTVALFLFLDEDGTSASGGIVLFTALCCFSPVAIKSRHDRLRDRAFLLSIQTREAHRRLGEANEELRLLAERDPLTGLNNRRSFQARFDAVWQAAAKAGDPLAVIMIDLDHFKAFNDRFGHLPGDECIRRVAEVVADEMETVNGVAARFGGEEFVCVIAGEPPARIDALANNVLRRVRDLRVDVDEGDATTITVSLGVATGEPARASQDGLLERADQALYKAKEEGRDRAIFHRAGETLAA